MAETKADAEALIPRFKFERLLNQDQGGRRSSLLGSIDDKPALLILERAPFPTDTAYLGATSGSLARLRNLGANDVYFWFMARSGQLPAPTTATDSNSNNNNNNNNNNVDFFADLKVNLIYPCTETHVKKYSKQPVRLVTETPQIYRDHVRPYMQRKRDQGRLTWVYNIIEGRTEVEDVIFRTPLGTAGDEGFLLLPDLNWDRDTLEALHLLALVERRDLWSLRDLRRRHIPWLHHMRARLVDATVARYPSVEPDQLKLYVHYQPTYYHFHVHIVHVQLEAGATQATGKAVGLDSIIATLEAMGGDDDDRGMDCMSISYTLGEASELWTEVFAPLKARQQQQQQQEQRQQDDEQSGAIK